MKDWLIILGIGGAAWWLLRKSPAGASPVQISSLTTGIGNGNSAEAEVGLFDKLFGLRDASADFVKLQGVAKGLRTQGCHSDGTCDTFSIATLEKNPLKVPQYFAEFLGVNNY